MATIVIKVAPTHLANPDLDIRYELPDLLVSRSVGSLTHDGYDFMGENDNTCLLLFLHAEDSAIALPKVIETLRSEQVCGNDLSGLPVAILDGDDFEVVHPADYSGDFSRPELG